jgi:hypothetical protein
MKIFGNLVPNYHPLSEDASLKSFNSFSEILDTLLFVLKRWETFGQYASVEVIGRWLVKKTEISSGFGLEHMMNTSGGSDT